VALLILAFAAFGSDGGRALTPFVTQAQLRAVRSVPGMIGKYVLGLHNGAATLGPIFGAAFGLAVVGLVAKTRRDGRWIENTGWATVVLLVCVTWLMPWYVVWALPFAALGASPRLRNTVVALTLLMVLLRFPHLP
jgi:hypothetical protein